MKGKWTRLRQPVSQNETTRAVSLWLNGADTLEIATILKIPESQIYNELPEWRARAKGIA